MRQPYSLSYLHIAAIQLDRIRRETPSLLVRMLALVNTALMKYETATAGLWGSENKN